MSSATAKVTALYRYPIKSMGGEALDHAQLSELGIPGDRAWAVRDEERGGISGGKRFPGLMDLQARFAEEPDAQVRSKPARIEFPDGRAALSTDADIHEQLSSYLQSPVTLWPLLPADALEHYRRAAPTSADMEAQLREVFARTKDEPLPDLSQFPAELFEYESPPGTYFDAYPLLLMSQHGLDALEQQAPNSTFDVRRFRPNILIAADAAQPGYFEDQWLGQRLQIGSAQLEIKFACPRCVMTTHGFAELPKDPTIMRTLVGEHEGNLGIYATVTQPGEIKVGDSVGVLES